MSGYYQRNRDRGQYRGQNSGGGNYNRNPSYQRQGEMNRQQMVNPWQSGMMPAAGGAMQTGGNDEAALAFNILNQVLASDSGSMMGPGQGQGRGGGFQDRKSRHMGMGNRLEDRRRTQSPQFSRNRSDRGARPWSSRSRSPQHGRDGRSNSNRRDSSDRNKKPVMERLGKHSDKNKRYPEFKRNQGRDQTSGDKRKRPDDGDSDTKSRERQSSEDKNSEDEDTESKEGELSKKDQDTEGNAGKKLKGKEYDEYVTKCLKCHICEVDSFESIEAFRTHKRSDDHRLMANIYNDRSEAVLQLMRADAKLAANRDREKSGNANKETFSGVCIKCDCTVADALKSHKKTIEHELVDNYLTRECCGIVFARRKEFEDHRIAIPHLKRQMESQKENQENKKAVLAFTDDEIAARDTLRELKDTHRMELSSAADFPDYDATVPLGLGYVHKKRRFNCTVCKKSFPSYNNMALAHCRSFNHYMMMSTYLETKLKDVEDDNDDDDITETDEKNSQDGEEVEKEDTPVTDNGSPAAKEKKDEQEEETKEENVVEGDNDNENDGNDGDEEMGENLPPLEDGGILLEDIDKAAEDDGDGALEVAEDSENEAVGDDEEEEEEEEEEEQEQEEEEQEQEEEEEGEGIADEVDEPEEEDKVMEEVEADEEMKEDEVQEEEGKDEESADEETKNDDSADEANDTEEEVEEEEEVVKPKATRGRRGRARARGRGGKRNF